MHELTENVLEKLHRASVLLASNSKQKKCQHTDHNKTFQKTHQASALKLQLLDFPAFFVFPF